MALYWVTVTVSQLTSARDRLHGFHGLHDVPEAAGDLAPHALGPHALQEPQPVPPLQVGHSAELRFLGSEVDVHSHLVLDFFPNCEKD